MHILKVVKKKTVVKKNQEKGDLDAPDVPENQDVKQLCLYFVITLAFQPFTQFSEEENGIFRENERKSIPYPVPPFEVL